MATPSRPFGDVSGIIVVSLVSAALAFATVSVSQAIPPRTNLQTFSGSLWTFGQPPCIYCPYRHVPTVNLTAGTNVTLQWRDLTGGLVEFLWASNSSGWVVCGPTGSSGGCEFESIGGAYAFNAYDEANQSMQTVAFSGQSCDVNLGFCSAPG
jgi:hypothetical protein